MFLVIYYNVYLIFVESRCLNINFSINADANAKVHEESIINLNTEYKVIHDEPQLSVCAKVIVRRYLRKFVHYYFDIILIQLK